MARRFRSRTTPAAAMIGAAALLVVLVAVVVRAYRSTGSVDAARRSGAAFVGGHWRLTAVEKAGQVTDVPTSVDAFIGFAPDGTLGMSDAVNYMSGHYRVTADGFAVSELASTAVGYAGGDPVRTAVIAAIGAIGYGPMTEGSSLPVVTVSASVSGSTLTVRPAGYTLTFVRTGDEHVPAPASATSGSTSTTFSS